MPTSIVALDTKQYVRINADIGAFILQAHRDTVRVAFSVAKPTVSNTAFHQLKGDDEPLIVPFTEDNIWALAMTDHSSLVVTEQRFPVEISDRDNLGLSVFIQDQTSPVLTVPFLQGRASTSLTVDTVLESRDITLTAGHGTLVGEIIELADPNALKFMQSEVVAVNVNVVTLDQPVNRVYFVSTAIVQRSSRDMLIDGSVTPQIFSILPLPSQAGDMVRIILEIEGDGDMDSASFGSDPALVNGCVIRVSEPDGNFKNLFNFKSNGDFLAQGFDHNFLQPRVPGNTTRAFNSRVTWGGQSKHGVVIRLDGSLNEQLQVVIQDDLTLGINTKFNIQAEGHELQE